MSSSSEEAESSVSSDHHRFPSVSSLAHAMVQERLDQLIKEKHVERRRHHHHHHKLHHHHHHKEEDQEDEEEEEIGGAKFVVMVAMEKCSYDPREDFRESMVEMIMANRLQHPKDLRSLLNYYVSMNSQLYHSLIFEVFHEVCSNLFLSCKCHW